MLGFCRSSPNNGSAIVCEYIGRGSLYDQLHKVMGRSVVLLILYVDYYFVFNFTAKNKHGTLSWTERISILKDTVTALAFLHASSKPLVHQDIKS